MIVPADEGPLGSQARLAPARTASAMCDVRSISSSPPAVAMGPLSRGRCAGARDREAASREGAEVQGTERERQRLRLEPDGVAA